MVFKFTVKCPATMFYPKDISIEVSVEATTFKSLLSMIPEAIEVICKAKDMINNAKKG